MAKDRPFRLEATYTPIAKRSCSRSTNKHRVLGVRGVPVSAPLGVELTYFYFGGVKMKKLGWGLYRNEWVAHFYVANTTEQM